jgi:transposase-like protein
MGCIGCGSAAVSERSERTAQGYRRFRCRACGKQFNERSAGSLNRTQYPSDVIALVVLWRLRDKLALRDLPEMFLIRGRDRLKPGGWYGAGWQRPTGRAR